MSTHNTNTDTSNEIVDYLPESLYITVGSYDNTLACFKWSMRHLSGADYPLPNGDEADEDMEREFSSIAALISTKSTGKNPEQFRPLFMFNAHQGCVTAVHHPKQRMFLSAGEDEQVFIYDLRTEQQTGSIVEPHGGIRYMTSSHGHLIIANNNGSFSVYELPDLILIKNFKEHQGVVECVSVHPSGRIMLSVGTDQMLLLWNMLDGKVMWRKKYPRFQDLTHVAWSPEGDSYGVTAGRHVYVVDAKTGKELFTMEDKKKLLIVKYITNNIIAVSGESKQISIINIENGIRTHILQKHQSRVRNIDVKPISNDHHQYILTSVCTSGILALWQLDLNQDQENNESNKNDHNAIVLEPLSYLETNGRLTSLAVSKFAPNRLDDDERAMEEIDQQKDKKHEKRVAKKKKKKMELLDMAKSNLEDDIHSKKKNSKKKHKHAGKKRKRTESEMDFDDHENNGEKKKKKREKSKKKKSKKKNE
eukprot:gb/GECH01000797.1/.p1 GENE.gb/GECH01000797.1/~~gb/GECH01000797.1/.p1  ORF type:complete len:477 (+),score=133.15 gb/GECH01000797.1/:1-1431(+)